MARKQKKRKKDNSKKETTSFSLKEETKRNVFGILLFVLAIIFLLSFFQKAGVVGKFLFELFSFLIGKAIFFTPVILAVSGFIFLKTDYKNFFKVLILANILFILGISGIMASWSETIRNGGWLGNLFIWPLLRLLDIWVTRLVILAAFLLGNLLFWNLLKKQSFDKTNLEREEKPSLIKKIFAPSFKVKRVEPEPVVAEKPVKENNVFKLNSKIIKVPVREREYKAPPFDLLEATKGQPSAGDIRNNSAIIKKALESFEISVEMSGVSIGPTVTQYSLKPADGIKLSKITSLSNDLALALANHPIRIEAPIPGKSLVGIEVPNKVRSTVRLRELIQSPELQGSSQLTFCLGKDVSGVPMYADLGRMPHLLVAGSTGTGKTIFLNSLILSLIYRNSPDDLKLILIDPKRVEFTVYVELPHLLCPAIVESSRAVNALKWLVDEMERRFKLLASVKSRNILSYNGKALKSKEETLPYIVLIIDELADLMAAKGRDVESSIVRLAQMARAVGIHLVVATQRPSVEVITGLIKANIASRVTFQVASQVDSRTVLDSSGAEKLLGAGDMLFISNEIIKPKRLQGAYVSEQEVKKIVHWLRTNDQPDVEEELREETMRESLNQALEKDEELSGSGGPSTTFSQTDSLYEEAKNVVVQERRASASLLQRKLRVGYARAARLIDILEEKGVVGPARGSKSRKVNIVEQGEGYSVNHVPQQENDYQDSGEEQDDDHWQAV